MQAQSGLSGTLSWLIEIMHEPLTLSPFQQRVIELLRNSDAQLSNWYVGDAAPYRPCNGMYSGILYPNTFIPHRRSIVPYRTIATLLRQGVMEESHRVSSITTQGESRAWEDTTIYYRLSISY